MKNILLISTLFLLAGNSIFAQVGISADNIGPDPSAGLDLRFNNKGFLIPRMSTADRNAIASPAAYLMILNTTTRCIEAFNELSSAWETIHCFECPVPATPAAAIHVTSATQIEWNWVPVSGAAGYKWCTTNDYSSAMDLGTSVTKIEGGLICGTNYTRYVWAYNACGNSAILTVTKTTSACPFSCGQIFTDSRDGKTYNTVLIGAQCWFAQNLNVGTKIIGSVSQTNNNMIEKYCYEDNDANCEVYGGMYQWDEVMNYTSSSNSNPSGSQGICPAGWHVPSDAEWCQLEIFLDASVICTGMHYRGTNAGGKLKEAGYTHWSPPNVGATNTSGFNGLPGGGRTSGGSFFYFNLTTHFWTSTESSTANGWYRYLNYNHAESLRENDYNKYYGMYQRCCKD